MMKDRTIRIATYFTLIAIALLFNMLLPQKTVTASNSQLEAEAAPANDNIANAILLESPVSLSVEYDTSGAGSEATDPIPIRDNNCDIDATAATVWYRYDPASTSALSIDTAGSSYDTFIAVWSGPDVVTSPLDLTLVACHDDYAIAILTSELSVQLPPLDTGTYYIEIGHYAESGGSSLEAKKK